MKIKTLSTTLLGIDSLAKSRLEWIDMAKGIAIILVVFRHIVIGLSRAGIDIGSYYEAASTITYSFRMPLFFILSGFFLRKSIEKRKFKQFLNAKFSTLLYPYLVWTFIQVSIQIYLSSHLNSNRSIEDYLYIFIAPREIDHFWFIYALFNISITYFLFIKLFKDKKWLIFLLAILMYHTGHYLKINVFQDVLNFFVYAVIGDIISSYVLNPSNESKISSPKFLIPMSFLFVVSQWVYLTNEELNHFLYGLIALIGSVFTLSLSFSIGRIRWLF
ncbi:MAG: acyltransferase family protein, partial [Cyclobacteriaceae bacterium]|nr:acyltransferase family protein [Cyclobacteriaceae bacterium SS2]